MAREQKVAIVTGSNKGIGLEIVKQLAERGVTTILTARDEGRGIEAVNLLKAEHNLHVHFHQLDVNVPESVSNLATWLHKNFGNIDILINNAGINIEELSQERSQAVLETNYVGVKRTIEELLPLMKLGSRIINVSSILGQLNREDRNSIYKPLKNEQQVQKFTNIENLNEQAVCSCLKEFIEAVGRGNLEKEGYPPKTSAYIMSKVALNAYTRILALQLESKGIFINAVCPGYTKTDLNDMQGTRSVEQGADTIVWLATLQSGAYPTGKFFTDRCEIHF